jgi:hypothetical protein
MPSACSAKTRTFAAVRRSNAGRTSEKTRENVAGTLTKSIDASSSGWWRATGDVFVVKSGDPYAHRGIKTDLGAVCRVHPDRGLEVADRLHHRHELAAAQVHHEVRRLGRGTRDRPRATAVSRRVV